MTTPAPTTLYTGRPAAGRCRRLQRHPRVPGQLPRRLGRAPIRKWPARRDHALDRDPDDRRADPETPTGQGEPARHLRQRHQLVTGAWAMKPYFRKAGNPASHTTYSRLSGFTRSFC
jgi:hypothetical protein